MPMRNLGTFKMKHEDEKNPPELLVFRVEKDSKTQEWSIVTDEPGFQTIMEILSHHMDPIDSKQDSSIVH